MAYCSKCGAPIRDGADQCWNCGEVKYVAVTDPDGLVRNQPYVPKKRKNRRGCALIVVVTLIILVVLECIPLFEVKYLGGLPTLSTALKMTKEPYYQLAKQFVDFMVVMMILAIVSLVGGVFGAKKLSLFSSGIAVLYMLQIYFDAIQENDRLASELMQFTIGFYILLIANIVIVISSLVE